MRLLSLIFLLFILVSFFPPIYGQSEDEGEKGEFIIDTLICSNQYQALIFYHREWWVADYTERGPQLLKIIHFTVDGQLIHTSSPIEVPLSKFGLIQENASFLRLIGWQHGSLYELWFNKDDYSATIIPKSNFNGILNGLPVYFPDSPRYQTSIGEYTLIGYTKRDDGIGNLEYTVGNQPVIISTNGSVLKYERLYDILQPFNITFFHLNPYPIIVSDQHQNLFIMTFNGLDRIYKLDYSRTDLTSLIISSNPTDLSIQFSHNGVPFLFFRVEDSLTYLNLTSFESSVFSYKPNIEGEFLSPHILMRLDKVYNLHIIHYVTKLHMSRGEFPKDFRYTQVNPHGEVKINITLESTSFFRFPSYLVECGEHLILAERSEPNFGIINTSNGVIQETFPHGLTHISYDKGISFTFPTFLILIFFCYQNLQRKKRKSSF